MYRMSSVNVLCLTRYVNVCFSHFEAAKVVCSNVVLRWFHVPYSMYFILAIGYIKIHIEEPSKSCAYDNIFQLNAVVLILHKIFGSHQKCIYFFNNLQDIILFSGSYSKIISNIICFSETCIWISKKIMTF